MEEKPPGKAGRLFSVNNLPIHGAEAPEKERKPTLSGLTLKLTAYSNNMESRPAVSVSDKPKSC